MIISGAEECLCHVSGILCPGKINTHREREEPAKSPPKIRPPVLAGGGNMSVAQILLCCTKTIFYFQKDFQFTTHRTEFRKLKLESQNGGCLQNRDF